MGIYRKSNHRQIYEARHGQIPVDCDGRTFEIHHIDGNPLNNSIDNLVALSIKDHYDIHYQQEDWLACFRIAKRMNISPEEKSELARKSNMKRVKSGTHNFQNKEWASKRAKEEAILRVKNGTHNLLRANRTFTSTGRVPDATIHTFKNKRTKEIVTMTSYDFVKTYSLNQGNVSSMIKHPTRSVKGWQCLDSSTPQHY